MVDVRGLLVRANALSEEVSVVCQSVTDNLNDLGQLQYRSLSLCDLSNSVEYVTEV